VLTELKTLWPIRYADVRRKNKIPSLVRHNSLGYRFFFLGCWSICVWFYFITPSFPFLLLFLYKDKAPPFFLFVSWRKVLYCESVRVSVASKEKTVAYKKANTQSRTGRGDPNFLRLFRAFYWETPHKKNWPAPLLFAPLLGPIERMVRSCIYPRGLRLVEWKYRQEQSQKKRFFNFQDCITLPRAFI